MPSMFFDQLCHFYDIIHRDMECQERQLSLAQRKNATIQNRIRGRVRYDIKTEVINKGYLPIKDLSKKSNAFSMSALANSQNRIGFFCMQQSFRSATTHNNLKTQLDDYIYSNSIFLPERVFLGSQQRLFRCAVCFWN